MWATMLGYCRGGKKVSWGVRDIWGGGRKGDIVKVRGIKEKG